MSHIKKSHLGAWALGLLVLVVGVAWILNNIGVIDFPIYNWWPLILVVIGVLYLILHRRMTALGGWFMIILGAIFLLTANNIVEWKLIWKIWPVILVFFGLLIIFQKRRIDKTAEIDHEDTGEGPEPSGDRIRRSSIFGGITEKVKSENFKGGIIYTVFGGAFINLRSAELDEKGAVLDLFSTFGGITIRLPKSWAIEVRTNTVLGGCHQLDSQQRGSQRKRLIINAISTLGGISIIN